ncbi:SAM-dependent methyltransferase [Geomesophilobacter sediminis]|uniref:Class I SAM-dependent methyltransferase n=1 Tax=Geomesophilobacter sediminis TaxID=2798584 RepID=A0A8J7S7V8_9BACT|nr:cyclopropane-fatty-acyl-phospholipid synthase family protein [Geomesophilobacter sediminis]MBJ6727256.1 class I SAM-dependent methyltransferase [Geomesophilobacter sediminis]
MESTRGYGVGPSPLFRNCTKEAGRSNQFDRFLMHALLRGLGIPNIRIILWDDSEFCLSDKATVGVRINSRMALLRLLANPLAYFGDDYSAGNLEVEGGLVPFLETVLGAMSRPGQVRRRSRSMGLICRPGRNTLTRSRNNVHHHYDLGNDFYRLWLDQEMQYTCAYFPDAALSIEQAQEAKMELVCRKLRLKKGDRVVEAGCGWGGLARYMAKCYGAKVRAFNISREQVAYARETARREGIEGVEYVEDDYRNITGTCDAFVSVGMLEHVGPGQYRQLGAVIDRTLTDRGMGLIHTIGQNVAEPMSDWIEKRIFPGSYPPTVREMMEIFEPNGLSLLDLENLRLHYAKTLQHWLARFENNSSRIARMFDESFVRAWRLYLASSIASFEVGTLQLYQAVFARSASNDVPWTRDHLRVR